MVHPYPTALIGPLPRPANRTPGRPRPSAALAVAGLVVLAACSASAAKDAGRQAGAQRPIPVVAVIARTGDMGLHITGLGTVTPVNTVTVRSRIDGQLDRVIFREGQLVNQGDLLIQIDPRPFQMQLLQVEAALAKDEATLNNARVDLQRYQTLLAQDAVPRQQLDTQQATVHQLEATLQSDRAQVENARLNLAYSRVTAPISGRVGLRPLDAGNMVHASDPNGLVVITQLQPINVVFTLAADQLPAVMAQIQAGHKLTVEAWDRELRKQLATGTLAAVDNQIDTTTGTVRLKAQFPNQDDALFANQFVNARLLVDTLRGVVIVPTAALQRSPQSTYVWVAKPDATAEMRKVEVRLTEGDDTALTSGVEAGEAVVTDGVDKLQPGAKVQTGASGAGREAGGDPGHSGPAAASSPSPGKGRPAGAGGGRRPGA